MRLPLDGIVVADLTQNVAGPFCAQTLGDMGAEGVKVERPGRGDNARSWGPPHALVAAVSARTRRFETADLLERLSKAGVPAAPILTIDCVLDEPQTAASGMIIEAAHPRVPGYRTVGLPIRWQRERPGVRRLPPLVGEHSVDVLTWLGYTHDDVHNLQGVVG